jgi:hypothetical protein
MRWEENQNVEQTNVREHCTTSPLLVTRLNDRIDSARTKSVVMPWAFAPIEPPTLNEQYLGGVKGGDGRNDQRNEISCAYDCKVRGLRPYALVVQMTSFQVAPEPHVADWSSGLYTTLFM